MKLWYAQPSPFVRKVLMLAHETGIIDQIELIDVKTTALDPDPDLAKANPLGKIPVLVLDNDMSIFDSAVICEYLDGLHDGPRMLPENGEARLNVQVAHSLGNGIMETAVAIRYEQALRPPEKQWDVWMDGQFKKISQALDVLETWRGAKIQDIHLGSITVASALAYLDFRNENFNWREGRPLLTQMLDTFSKRQSMLETRPQ